MNKYFVSYVFSEPNSAIYGYGNAEVDIKGKFDKKKVQEWLLKQKKNRNANSLIILFFKKL